MALRQLIGMAAALWVGATSIGAQVAYNSPHGRVEVLGLRRWTLDMLRDSIRRYVPGQELHDAACVVTLRDSLHFVDASVEHFEMAPPGQPARSFLTVKVIEPQDSGRVQWDTRPRNTFSAMLPAYSPILLPLTDSTGALWRGRLLFWLQFTTRADREAAALQMPSGRRADEKLVADFLSSQSDEPARRRAMRVLTRDGYWANRMVAVTVLSNFAAHDSTWFTVVRALRDPHEGVREAAAMTLRGLPPRVVDWGPAAADLRLLINGTNLRSIEILFEQLANTRIAPSLAPALLRDNAGWILEHLGSEKPVATNPAHRLLIQLNGGRDLGKTKADWTTWAAKL